MNDVVTGPVRWGFIGAGNIARTALAPAVHAADGAVLQAAAARDPARAATLRPVRVHATYDDLLAADDVDAVYISLNNDAHLPWTLAALQAGKHVLCEKPLGLTAAEVDRMVAAAQKAGRTVVEASWYRWHPRVRLAQARLPEIGPVAHVTAGFSFDGVPAGDYRLDPARGGGALYDVGCYAVSACLWAVGRGLPDEVVARADKGPTGVDLDTRAVLSWADGPDAEVRAGISGTGQWLVITGERGEIELRDAPFTAWKDNATELWVSDGSGTERAPVPATDAYRVMVEEMSSVLSGGPGWLLPLAQSRDTAAVLDAIRASAAADGAPVRPGPGPDPVAALVMLTVPELAQRLGTDVVNARGALRAGTFLAVSRDGVLLVPERQLDGDQPVKHLVPVLRLLRDAKYTDIEALAWLATPDDSLPGSPFDALHENRATEVKRRAQALGF